MKGLSTRTKSLSLIWGLFILLVAFGVHGSSTGVTSGWWSPEKVYTGYLIELSDTLKETSPAVGPIDFIDVAMSRARWIRWDELLIATPLALSQLSHNPRFPVVNTNIGDGQNMLLSQHAPVLHVASLARPATWGYFFLGPQRGLAWYWWFQVFSCFTVLFLLLEIILKGHRRLAAFGAFWYCASAYVVCWSLWPAQSTFFGALACLGAYHLLASRKPVIQLLCAVVSGLGLAGFAMIIYPPWQVPLAYLFVLIFAGLFIRDKLYLSFKPISLYRVISIAGAIVVAGGLVLSFVITCSSDFQAMSNTVYPGNRVSLGGDYSFAMLFKGMYNLMTIYSAPPALTNQSEAASFYYLFPSVLFAICLSKRWRGGLGIFGWLLVTYVAGLLFFMLVGIPEIIAKVTMLSYVPPYRADIALGLASIILCVYALARSKDMRDVPARGSAAFAPWIASAGMVFTLLLQGVLLTRKADGFPAYGAILLVSLLAGFLSYCMLSGKSRIFCGVLTIVLIATTAFFNPLSTNLDHLYKTELAEQITRLNEQSPDRPLWLCYGGVQPGILVTLLGGRSLSGVHWPPQLSLWRRFDAEGAYDRFYNRYAQVSLGYKTDTERVSFHSGQEDSLEVRIAPGNPVAKSLGARFVLALGDMQKQVKFSKLNLVYESAYGHFSIFEIPSDEGI